MTQRPMAVLKYSTCIGLAGLEHCFSYFRAMTKGGESQAKYWLGLIPKWEYGGVVAIRFWLRCSRRFVP